MKRLILVMLLMVATFAVAAQPKTVFKGSIQNKLCARSAANEIKKILKRQGQPANQDIVVQELSVEHNYQINTANAEDGAVAFEVITYDMTSEDGTCQASKYRELPGGKWEDAL
jgi:hypothetical protein